MLLSVFISLSNKNDWSDITLRALPYVMFQIYAPAPSVNTVRMSQDYRYITITFDRPSIFANGRSCRDAFAPSTIKTFGKWFRCYFKKSNQLTVRLGRNPGLSYTGDTISLSAGAFVTRGESVTEASLSMNVTLPVVAKKITPVAVISGNTVYSICDEVVIHGRGSTGHGGRTLKYIWDIQFASTVNLGTVSTADNDGLSVLRTKLSALSPTRNGIRFMASELASTLEYKVSLKVRNFLNEDSNLVELLIKLSSDILPTISIMGGNKQSLRVSKTSKVVGKARLPKCSTKKFSLSFFWEIDFLDVTLHKSRQSPRLYIFPGTLKGGNTYVLTLTVSIKEQPSSFTTTSVTIEAISTPLRARIRGGSKRVLSVNDDFSLDGSVSRDSDREDSIPWYDWECQEMSGAACFVRNVTNPVEQYVRFQAPSLATLVVKNNSLAANKTYKFILNFHKGTRHASTSVTVSIKAGNPPVVRVFSTNNVKEDISKRIALKGYVKTQSLDTRIWFVCADDVDNAFIDITEPGVLLTPSETTKRRVGFHRLGIVFASNVLTEGASYKFILYAENADGRGSSEVIIITNSSPTVGELEVVFENNTALESEFTLSAITGWEDSEEDMPLLYTFGFISPETGKKQFLGVPLSEKEMITKLPAGPETNGYNLTVFVEVADVHGAKAFTTSEVNVVPITTLDSSVINNAKGSIDKAFAANDLAGALSEISSTLSTFNLFRELLICSFEL